VIDPVTALGGSSLAGSVIGLILSWINTSSNKQVKLAEILRGEQKETNEHVINYQKTINGARDPYAFCVFILTCTYCLAVSICFFCGDIPVATQGFGEEPSTISIAFGLFTRSTTDKSVYLLTFAGLGTYFMSPIAYILTVKLTGLTKR
jgi:hypothetical protein